MRRGREEAGREGPSCLSVALWLRMLDPPLMEVKVGLSVEWILGKLKVCRELLDRVKSLKLGFYGHTTRNYESLEKEIVQGCVPGYRNPHKPYISRI